MNVSKVNPFAQVFSGQEIKPIQQTPAIVKQPTEETAAKPTEASAGNTVGVNTNIGVGDSMNLAAQAGKPAGIGKTLYFA